MRIPFAVGIDLQNRSNIATAVTVVRRWPYRHQLLAKHVLVALVDDLVVVHHVTLSKLTQTWWARHINSSLLISIKSSVTDLPKSHPAPRGDVSHWSIRVFELKISLEKLSKQLTHFLRIRPHQIAKCTLVRDFLVAFQRAYLICE